MYGREQCVKTMYEVPGAVEAENGWNPLLNYHLIMEVCRNGDRSSTSGSTEQADLKRRYCFDWYSTGIWHVLILHERVSFFKSVSTPT